MYPMCATAGATLVERNLHSLKIISVFRLNIRSFVRLRARERAQNRNDSIFYMMMYSIHTVPRFGILYYAARSCDA